MEQNSRLYCNDLNTNPMNYEIQNILNRLRKELNNPLPGNTAHRKMIPVGRSLEPLPGVIKITFGITEFPGYLVNDVFIWGATAMILAEFVEVYRKISTN